MTIQRIGARVFLVLSVAALVGCGGGGGGGGGGGTSLATVSGVILDSANQPVPGVTVTVASDPVSTVTGTNGEFSLRVEPGLHSLTAVKDGYVLYFDDSLDVGTEPSPLGSVLPTNPYYETAVTWYADADGDGFGDVSFPSGPSNFRPGSAVCDSADCDDTTAALNPATVWYRDMDGDGYSDGALQTQCEQPAGHDLATNLSATSGDCDDADLGRNPTTTWYRDSDDDGYSDGATSTQCAQPAGHELAAALIALSGDCDDTDPTLNPGTAWYADRDSDMYSNGDIMFQCAQPLNYYQSGDLSATSGDCDDYNEGLNPTTTWYSDRDNDGYSDGTTQLQCARPAGYELAAALISLGGDCDDTDSTLYPGITWYADLDGDGYSNGNFLVQCPRPDGFYRTSELASASGDCDDNDTSSHQGAVEVCDGADNDCDTMTDDADPTVSGQTSWHTDADRDGFGDNNAYVMACTRQPGYLSTAGDCDDADAAINPQAIETCDTLDNNCNGAADEGVTATFFPDADTDGYGNGSASVQACTTPEGHITWAGDCDDSNALINPEAIEVCDSLDNDCDGTPDGGAFCRTGQFGNCGWGTTLCVDAALKCLPDILPSTESCDGQDNDCDGSTDEIGCSPILLVDDDAGIGNRVGERPSTTTDPVELDWLYTSDMAAVGISHDLYRVFGDHGDGPPLEVLDLYSIVIWFTGWSYNDSVRWTLTDPDRAALASYLDSGGRLLMVSQDLLYEDFAIDGTVSAFASSYLGVAGASSDAGEVSLVSGVLGDPVSDGLAMDGCDVDRNGSVDGFGEEVYTESGTAAWNSAAGTLTLQATSVPSGFITVFDREYSILSLADDSLSFGEHHFWGFADGTAVPYVSDYWFEPLSELGPNRYLKLFIDQGLYTLQEQFGNHYSAYPDVLNPAGTTPAHASTLLVDGNGDAVATRSQSGLWRTIFLAYPYEGLKPDADRRQFLFEALGWLGTP